MTAITAGPVTRGEPSRLAVLAALGRIEARRFALNPIFLAAAGCTAYVLWDRQRGVVADVNTVLVYPAIFLGGLGMVAAFWLTQSMRRSDDALGVAPMSEPERTGALCLAMVVPLLCGALSLLAIVVFQQVPGPWSYGALGTSGGVAAAVSQVVVPALGGPLLGVALGRWIRFPGSAALVFLAAWGWITLLYTVTATLAAAHRQSTLVVMLRFFAPFTFFTDEDSPGRIETWRGSPWFFLGWQLCLCGAAVIVALLRGADPRLRTRLLRLLAGVLALAGLMYALAVVGGWAYPVLSTPGAPPVPIAGG
jgi:hypothetical protein